MDSSGSALRYSQGNIVPARAMLSVRDTEIATQNITWIWTVGLLVTTDNIIPVLANTVLFLCCQVADIRPRPTNGVVLSICWQHWQEILQRIHAVKTARTLPLCCVFSNSIEYSARRDVLIVQVMYQYLSLENTLVQCHCQNAWHWSQQQCVLKLWCLVLGWV